MSHYWKNNSATYKESLVYGKRCQLHESYSKPGDIAESFVHVPVIVEMFRCLLKLLKEYYELIQLGIRTK